jgi:hypothetical protein
MTSGYTNMNIEIMKKTEEKRRTADHCRCRLGYLGVCASDAEGDDNNEASTEGERVYEASHGTSSGNKNGVKRPRADSPRQGKPNQKLERNASTALRCTPSLQAR